MKSKSAILIMLITILSFSCVAGVASTFAGFIAYGSFNVLEANKVETILDKNYTKISLLFTNWVKWNATSTGGGIIRIVDQTTDSTKYWNMIVIYNGQLDLWYYDGATTSKLAGFNDGGHTSWAYNGTESIEYEQTTNKLAVYVTVANGTKITVLEAGFDLFKIDRIYTYGIDGTYDAESGYMDVLAGSPSFTYEVSGTSDLINQVIPIIITFAVIGMLFKMLEKMTNKLGN